jgi:hypothetical protein
MRALFALWCAGCLSTPARPAEEGSADARPLADAGPTQAFPPDLAIRPGPLTAELNGDVADDLLLLHQGADSGVIVMYGKAEGFLAGYDLILETPGAQPVAAFLADVIGGAPLDVMVLAQTDSGGDAVVYVFENLVGSFAEPALRIFAGVGIEGGSATDPMPAFIAAAYVNDTSARAAVFGDLTDVKYFNPVDWSPSAVASASARDLVSPTPPWSNVNHVVPVPSQVAGRADLVVFDNAQAYWFYNDGTPAGGYGGEAPAVVPLDDVNGRRSYRNGDFDASGVDDVATIRDNVLTFMQLDVPLRVAVPLSFNDGVDGMDLDFVDDQLDDWALVNLDGPPNLELVNVDSAPGSPDYGIRIFGNLQINGTEVIQDMPNLQFRMFAGRPTRLAVGDFDGSGEKKVLVFDAAFGDRLCFVHSKDEFQRSVPMEAPCP